MGLIVLPTMLRFGYDPRLAAGTVAATATLAQIFPPATVLVLLGDQLGNAYQAAQLAQGIFAPRSVTVSDLFAGALLPGFALVALYLLYLIAVAIFCPKAAPAIPPDPNAPRGFALARRLVAVLVAPVLLILGGARLDPRRRRDADRSGLDRRGRRHPARRAQGAACAALLMPVVEKTTQITAMIFLILIGATLFSLVFRALGGDDMVQRALANLPGGVDGAVLAVMLAMFLLGFVMDAFEIIFVVVPIVAPALLKMPGVDPVWLGIMMAVNLQTSYMHPPLGPTLFYPARRGAARDHHAAHLCRHHPVRADPAFRAGGAVVRAGACDRAAACALWPVRSARRRPEPLGDDPEPHRAGEQQRQQDGGGAHVLDALDGRIVVERDAVAQLLDRGVEQFDDEDEHERRRSAQAACRCPRSGRRRAVLRSPAPPAPRGTPVPSAPPQRGRASC